MIDEEWTQTLFSSHEHSVNPKTEEVISNINTQNEFCNFIIRYTFCNFETEWNQLVTSVYCFFR